MKKKTVNTYVLTETEARLAWEALDFVSKRMQHTESSRDSVEVIQSEADMGALAKVIYKALTSME